MRGVALLLAGVAALAAGCGSPGATQTAASSTPSAAAAALPLTEAEHDFVQALADEHIGDNVDVRTLVGYGDAACRALSSGAVTPKDATAAVKAVAARSTTPPLQPQSRRRPTTSAPERQPPARKAPRRPRRRPTR